MTEETNVLEQKINLIMKQRNCPTAPQWKRAGETTWLNMQSGIAVRLSSRTPKNGQTVYVSSVFSLHNSADAQCH